MADFFSKSLIAEGTVLINVMLRFSGSEGKLTALSASTTAPPQLNGTNISKIDKSKQTDVDASSPASSSSENTSRAQWMNETALRCSSATPFETPVEPEVYITYAVSLERPIFAGLPVSCSAMRSQLLSRHTNRAALAGTCCNKLDCVTTSGAFVSLSMKRTRSGGYVQSSGTYAAPALN